MVLFLVKMVNTSVKQIKPVGALCCCFGVSIFYILDDRDVGSVVLYNMLSTKSLRCSRTSGRRNGAGLIGFWRITGNGLQSKLVFDGMPPQKGFSKVWRSSWPHAAVRGASADRLVRLLLAQCRKESEKATGVLLPGKKAASRQTPRLVVGALFRSSELK